MQIEPALLSPVSMFFGALIGGSASLLAAIYTRRNQNQAERIACEVAKREKIYGEFLMSASNFLLHAFTHDNISLDGEEQRLMGLLNRMRLFATDDVLRGAEAALRAIVEVALTPGVELRQLAKQALSKRLDPDPLLAFSRVCRDDLDRVRREGV